MRRVTLAAGMFLLTSCTVPAFEPDMMLALRAGQDDSGPYVAEVSSAVPLREKQTVQIRETEIKDLYNLAIGPLSSPSIKITVHITRYQSGSYVGFAKTAKLAVKYVMMPRGSGVTESFEDKCERTVAFDLRPAPRRNRQAVLDCLSELALRLRDRLTAHESDSDIT